MTISRQSSRREWEPEQVRRVTVAVVALVVIGAGLALGTYGYTPSRLPDQVTDKISAYITPTGARDWLWMLVAAGVTAALAGAVWRASLHLREVLISAAVLVGAILVVLALYRIAGVGAGTIAPHLTRAGAGYTLAVIAAEILIAAAVLVGRLDLVRRRQFAEGLVEVWPKHIRHEFQPRKVETRRWRKGRPAVVGFPLPKGFAATSTTALAELTKAMTDRMGGKVDHRFASGRAAITFTRIAVKARDVHRDHETDRITQMGSQQFRSEITIVKVEDWGGDDGDTPIMFTARYAPTAPVTDEGFCRRIEVVFGQRIGVPLKANFEPTKDLVHFVPRPEIPERILHPGSSMYRDFSDWTMIPIGVDEDGEFVFWNAKLQSHALGNGATNSGKTITARSVIVGALILGWEVYLADPKQIELVGFGHDWGVKSIAATPADMGDLIARIRALMDERYTEIKTKIDQRIDPKINDTYRPVLVVIDEFAELVEVMNGKVDEVWALLRLARACNIHLLIMTQRPDASDFKKGARDNLTFRYSMNALSEQGAKMMWENTEWGRYLRAIKGRGMAGVYGQEPREVQCFLFPDPAFPEPEHVALRDEVRAACSRVQAEIPASITGADYDLPKVKPAPEGDLNNIVTDPGELLTVILDGRSIEAATVLAETLTAGDRVIIDDQTWDVIHVRDDAATEQISADLDATDGSRSQTITRAITDHVLSVVTTGKPIAENEPEDIPAGDKGATLLRALAGFAHRHTGQTGGDANSDATRPEGQPIAADQAVVTDQTAPDQTAVDHDADIPAGGETGPNGSTIGSADDAIPPIPLFGVDDDDDDDLFRPPRPADDPDQDDHNHPVQAPPTEVDTPVAVGDDEFASTLRRAWGAITDPAARAALLDSAPDTPAIQALRFELATTPAPAETEPATHDDAPVAAPAPVVDGADPGQGEPTISEPDERPAPAVVETVPPAGEGQAKAATPTPTPPPADPVDLGRRADSITVGEQIMWRTKKGGFRPYTVQDIGTADDGKVRLTIKPARGQSKNIYLDPAETVQRESDAA